MPGSSFIAFILSNQCGQVLGAQKTGTDCSPPCVHTRSLPAAGNLAPSAGARPATYEDHRDTAPDGESGARLRILHGEALLREVVITEHGIRFAVALYAAQKTGLFLDQRENRRFVEGLAAGRTVLNCFAYTGGFSLYALVLCQA